MLALLLHFLKIGILDGVVLFGATVLRLGAGLLTGICIGLRACLAVHLLAGGLHHRVEVVDGRVDGGNVGSLVGIFKLLESLLDARLLVGRNLVGIIFQEVLCGEYQRVGLIHLVHFLALGLVGCGVLFGLGLHTVDFFLTQTAAGLDTYLLFLACCLILGADVENTVGIDVERYLDLRNTAASRSNAFEVKLSDALVLRSHGAFAL